MAQKHINFGSSPNDGTGDFLRDFAIKSEQNFTELYNNYSTSTSITIIADSTVALNITEREAYYGIQTAGALLSLPPISGNETKKLIIANLSSGDVYLYPNDSVSEDILNFGTETNELTIPSGSVISLINDSLKWTLKSTNVSGTDGQIIVTDDNSTTVLSIDPAYTALIFDALALKENIINYKQQALFDFNFNTNIVQASGFTNVAINGGALSLQSDSITPGSLRTSRSDDISECWVVRGNAGSPNGGFTVSVASQNAFYIGHVMFMAIDVAKITDTNGRFGLVQVGSFSPLTSIAGNNAICVEIVGNQLTFKTSFASAGVSIAPSYTIPSTQWLYIMIEAESATTIRCKIRNGLNGMVVYNELIISSANIPLPNNVNWTQLRISLNAVATVASADNMFQYGKVATYAKKPNFLNYF